MAGVIYLLGALTAFACAWLLLRSYVRHHSRFLLWCGLCFSGMFVQNLMRVLDELPWVIPDLSTGRALIGLTSLLLLLYGLIWEDE